MESITTSAGRCWSSASRMVSSSVSASTWMAPGCCADPFGAHADLGRRLFAADQHDGALDALGADRVEHLEQQRGLADAGLAADQHERARHDAAAEHAVELGDAAREAVVGRRGEARERAHRGPAVELRTTAGRGGRAAPARRHAFDDLFGERVPGAAIGAASGPARFVAPALATGENDVVFARHPGRRPRFSFRRGLQPAKTDRRRRRPPCGRPAAGP